MHTIKYPFKFFPEDKKIVEVQKGVYWIKILLPTIISHVNVYVLEDDDEITIIDTGLACDHCKQIWSFLINSKFKNKKIKRIIITHHHPDHIGLLGWFVNNFNTEIWTSRSSWLTGRMLTLDKKKTVSKETLSFWQNAGIPFEIVQEKSLEKPFNFIDFVELIPSGYKRVIDKEILYIRENKWIVNLTDGHAPEHITLYSPNLKLFITGDQILPGISPNISVYPTEPLADPLAEYLKSLEKLLKIKDIGYLVLPGHNLPFYGLNVRIKQLFNHHKKALNRIEDSVSKKPKSAYDIMFPLFKRKIEKHEIDLALGEAVAHLNFLWKSGIIKKEKNKNGINLFVKCT